MAHFSWIMYYRSFFFSYCQISALYVYFFFHHSSHRKNAEYYLTQTDNLKFFSVIPVCRKYRFGLGMMHRRYSDKKAHGESIKWGKNRCKKTFTLKHTSYKTKQNKRRNKPAVNL